MKKLLLATMLSALAFSGANAIKIPNGSLSYDVPPGFRLSNDDPDDEGMYKKDGCALSVIMNEGNSPKDAFDNFNGGLLSYNIDESSEYHLLASDDITFIGVLASNQKRKFVMISAEWDKAGSIPDFCKEAVDYIAESLQ